MRQLIPIREINLLLFGGLERLVQPILWWVSRLEDQPTQSFVNMNRMQNARFMAIVL